MTVNTKYNTKSSITLPPIELKLVMMLMEKLGAKTKVEVIRRGLELLKDRVERDRLQFAYGQASAKTRSQWKNELAEANALAHEGLDD